MPEFESHEFRSPEPLPDYVPVARAIQVGNQPQLFDLPLSYAPAAPVQMFSMPMSRFQAVVELLIMIPVAIIGAWVAHLASGQLRFGDHRWMNVLSSMTMGAAVLIYIVCMLWIDGHRPATIGWRAHKFWRNVAVGIAGFVLMYVYAFLMVMVIVQFFPAFLEQEPASQKAIQETFPAMPFGFLFLMMLFVAIWEEVAFRGFLLTRLQAILRHWWLTVPIGAMIFGIIHIYQGILAVGLICIMGFIMGLLFVLRRSLVPCITFHFANNLIMMLLLRWISPEW